jgi:hypothetical protein
MQDALTSAEWIVDNKQLYTNVNKVRPHGLSYTNNTHTLSAY